MVKIILRCLGLLGVWGVVGGIVVFIEPEVIRDVGLNGIYLPLLIAIEGALIYTISWIVGHSRISVLIATILTVFVALLFYY